MWHRRSELLSKMKASSGKPRNETDDPGARKGEHRTWQERKRKEAKGGEKLKTVTFTVLTGGKNALQANGSRQGATTKKKSKRRGSCRIGEKKVGPPLSS